MKDGMVRVAAVTPDSKVANIDYNAEQIKKGMTRAWEAGAKVVVFPELCLSGYTCGDLFLQTLLLGKVRQALLELAEHTKTGDGIAFVGLPLQVDGALYNCAAAVGAGKILGIVPKRNLPNYSEFYELRHFRAGEARPREISIGGDLVPFGGALLFTCGEEPRLKVAAEICEDLWVACPPSIGHAFAGANVIVNLSASNEAVGKKEYRKTLVCGQSARLVCGYLYADAGEGESTTDLVFSGHNLIAENGCMLAQSTLFENGMILADLDMEKLEAERRRMTTFHQDPGGYQEILFHVRKESGMWNRFVDPHPFVPGGEEQRKQRCEEILNMQCAGLKKRLKHTGAKTAVIGISGGLDSTLALLVTVRAFDALQLDRKGILAVTMPCFGTTDRTYTNAVDLIHTLGADFREVKIAASVQAHFADIGQDPKVHDVTYENAQARERTQVLMDLANQTGGLVVGTGDLSELALGWATYNGDHMSMYGVNASVPKTLVRHIVGYCAAQAEQSLRKILLDILDTPVSPELLPPDESGAISQQTEDIVGPYELHDFYLYYMVRYGFAPGKIFRLAQQAFGETYPKEILLKWLKNFYRRFFAQQFKRSCLPDGPKVGSVALSPRGDWRMPSDADSKIWMDEIEKLEKDVRKC